MPPEMKKVRQLVLDYEERYPEFASFTLANEVAMVYGWGRAVEEWLHYCDLKEMLSHVAS